MYEYVCAQQSSADSFIFPLYLLLHKQHGNNTGTDDMTGIAEAHVDYKHRSYIFQVIIANIIVYDCRATLGGLRN
jgi:hypothetical protein